jgi:hypothetical protein
MRPTNPEVLKLEVCSRANLEAGWLPRRPAEVPEPQFGVGEATLGMVLTPWAVLLLQVAPVGILLRPRDLTEAERRSIDQTSSDAETLWRS